MILTPIAIRLRAWVWTGCVAVAAACGPSDIPVAPLGTADFEIPFEHYTLSNGLDVVLHEDHSDPIVAVATLVHVGSSRERLGRTGFAHLFERATWGESQINPRARRHAKRRHEL